MSSSSSGEEEQEVTGRYVRNPEDETLREIELMKRLMKKYTMKSVEKKKKIGKKPLQVGSFDINGIRAAERLMKWKIYISKIKKALNLYNFDDKEKLIHFELEIGKDFEEFIRVHNLKSENEEETFEELVEKITDKFKAGTNENDAAFGLEKIKQESNQTIGQFYAKLRELATAAGMENEQYLKMKFLANIRDKEFADFPLVLSEYSLEKCVQEAEIREERERKRKEESTSTSGLASTSAAAILLQKNQDEIIHRIENKYREARFNKEQRRGLKRDYEVLEDNEKCMNCNNKKHKKEESCPAEGAKCYACGGENHFARAPNCPKKKAKNPRKWKKVSKV
jgi:hypothetical protein